VTEGCTKFSYEEFNNSNVRLPDITAMYMKINIFGDVNVILAEFYRRFGGTYLLHPHKS
jgi:hypothetical protein